jgi:hypothetical protein
MAEPTGWRHLQLLINHWCRDDGNFANYAEGNLRNYGGVHRDAAGTGFGICIAALAPDAALGRAQEASEMRYMAHGVPVASDTDRSRDCGWLRRVRFQTSDTCESDATGH